MHVYRSFRRCAWRTRAQAAARRATYGCGWYPYPHEGAPVPAAPAGLSQLRVLWVWRHPQPAETRSQCKHGEAACGNHDFLFNRIKHKIKARYDAKYRMRPEATDMTDDTRGGTSGGGGGNSNGKGPAAQAGAVVRSHLAPPPAAMCAAADASDDLALAVARRTAENLPMGRFGGGAAWQRESES